MRADGAVRKVQSRTCHRERVSECLVDARKRGLSTGQMLWGDVTKITVFFFFYLHLIINMGVANQVATQVLHGFPMTCPLHIAQSLSLFSSPLAISP